MKKPYFSGAITALVTPFNKNKPDYFAFEQLIKIQMQNEIDGIILFGTTGEGISLTLSEKKSLILIAKRHLNGKIPIICGISSATTNDAVNQAIFYAKLGIDGLLVCTPYYYKTTTQGIYNHFNLIANSCNLPIIIYNVPARTNCDIAKSKALLKKFEKNPQFVAIKQAGITLEDCQAILKATTIPLFCGNDRFMFDLLASGYVGSISVCSNLIPKQIKLLNELISMEKVEEAKLLFCKILPLISAIELEPNPIPIKYATTLICKSKPNLRLPLTTAKKKTKLAVKSEYLRLLEEL